MQKIKILHIIKSLGRGGAEMLLPETLKLHDQNKFEFHYIYFLPWKDQMVEEIGKAGGKIRCFPSTNNWNMLGHWSNLMEYCKINEIALIHCHLPWSGLVGRIIYSQTKIPLIYTEHNVQERYHPLTKWLNKKSFNFQCLALGVSEDVTRSIIDNVCPKIPVQTLLNGVNTAFFQRDIQKGKNIKKNFNIPENAFVIGNIAVFREQKGIADWLNAIKKIIEEGADVYGILVGAGPEEDKIKAMVRKMKLKDRVFLPGLKTETVPYFSAMDVFMMSSKFEGLPIALLEAMSMGCAIVSTRAGGVVEVVREEEDGLLCNVGDWECLAQKIRELIENKDQLQEFKVAARKRVCESFSLKSMVQRLENIYNEQVQQQKS